MAVPSTGGVVFLQGAPVARKRFTLYLHDPKCLILIFTSWSMDHSCSLHPQVYLRNILLLGVMILVLFTTYLPCLYHMEFLWMSVTLGTGSSGMGIGCQLSYTVPIPILSPPCVSPFLFQLHPPHNVHSAHDALCSICMLYSIGVCVCVCTRARVRACVCMRGWVSEWVSEWHVCHGLTDS